MATRTLILDHTFPDSSRVEVVRAWHPEHGRGGMIAGLPGLWLRVNGGAWRDLGYTSSSKLRAKVEACDSADAWLRATGLAED